jgi:hypothetical protein
MCTRTGLHGRPVEEVTVVNGSTRRFRQTSWVELDALRQAESLARLRVLALMTPSHGRSVPPPRETRRITWLDVGSFTAVLSVVCIYVLIVLVLARG